MRRRDGVVQSGGVRGSLLLLAFLLLVAAPPVEGAGVAWGDSEVIASDVLDVSSGSGSSAVWQADAWHVVYAKAGAVRYAWRDAGGWHDGLVLAPATAAARNPHLGICDDGLIVVWDGTSIQEREVFARRGIFSSWGPTETLSADGIRSQAPVVSGFHSGPDALVVWEDSTSAGFRIRARKLNYQGWGAVEAVSTADADAREPTLTADPSGYGFGVSWCVAWSDWRDGEPEIYRRCWGDMWQDETRLTNLAPACRRPGFVLARSGDMPYPSPVVSFEADGPQGGATEVWILRHAGTPFVISADDGFPSHRSNLTGYRSPRDVCGLMPVTSTQVRVAWTDSGPLGTIIRSRWTYSGADTSADSIICSGPAAAILAAHPQTPTAPMLQVWTDLVAGRSTLLARVGTAPGCVFQTLTADAPVMVAPSGFPPTRLRLWDTCSGEGLSGMSVMLGIDPSLLDGIVLDAGQPLWMEEVSDADGWLEFPIRGGGCAVSGHAYADGGFNCVTEIDGAKSPDVNGDCVVAPDDRTYVEARLGTQDFCADLDHSGVVDAADLAIVDATMGDFCPNSAGIDEEGGDRPASPEPVIARLIGRPNPATEGVRLVLHGAGPAATPIGAGSPGGAVTIGIFDAAGRELRRIEALRQGDAWSADWDLRDGEGHAVPAGCYYARTRAGGATRTMPVLVIR